jgi:dehydrogenase/reductase SDR family protein 1
MGAAKADLRGQIAIVTGGSRGVGKGAALGLGEAGATVYVTARTVAPNQSPYPGSLAETISEIDELGGKGIALPCDHADDQAVKATIEQVIAKEGGIDILVNNVFSLPADLTLWSQASFWEQPISMWDDQINIGLRSHYVASAFSVPKMIERKSGLIVNISSSGAEQYHMNVAYGVGKAGVDKLTKDMAQELREHQVAVVSIWPGLVSTERIVDTMGREALETLGHETPIFTGRAIAALAGDPKILNKSGTRQLVCQLAEEYGFTDQGGAIPEAHGYIE